MITGLSFSCSGQNVVSTSQYITLVLGQLISVVAIGSLWSSPFLESKSKLPCLSFANSLVTLAKTIRPSHTQPNNPNSYNCCISKQKKWFTWNPIVLQWRNYLAAIVANLILPSSWLRTHLRPHAAQRTRVARNRAWCLSVSRFRVFRTKALMWRSASSTSDTCWHNHYVGIYWHGNRFLNSRLHEWCVNCEPSNSCQAWLHFQAWNVNGVPRDCDAIPAPVSFQAYTKLSAKDR